MSRIHDLFGQELNILNIGAPNFKDDLELQGIQVTQIKWAPPADGDGALIEKLDEYGDSEQVKEANEEVLNRIHSGAPVLVGMEQALSVIPGMTEKNDSSFWTAYFMGKDVWNYAGCSDRSADIRRKGRKRRRGKDVSRFRKDYIFALP